jgi:hypothetical protein
MDGETLLKNHISRVAESPKTDAKKAELLRKLSVVEQTQFEGLIWTWIGRIREWNVQTDDPIAMAERIALKQVSLMREHGMGAKFHTELNKLKSKIKEQGKHEANFEHGIRATLERGETKTEKKIQQSGSGNTGSCEQVPQTARLDGDTDKLEFSHDRKPTDPSVRSAKRQKFGI